MFNIRKNSKFTGLFELKGTKQKSYGFLNIHNGNIHLLLIGHTFKNVNTNRYINTSKDGIIVGKLSDSCYIVINDFQYKDVSLKLHYIPFCFYDVFSISFFNNKYTEYPLEEYNDIILNIDDLSHYLYSPAIFENSTNKFVLGNTIFHNIHYKILSHLHVCKEDLTSKFLEIKRHWINISIISNDKGWNNYVNIIPISLYIRNFIRFMTRINVDITNLIEIGDNHTKSSIYLRKSRNPHKTYISRLHHIDYLTLMPDFKCIFQTFLRFTINNFRTNSLINVILLINSDSQMSVENELIDCTNAIESYYYIKTRDRQLPLRFKLLAIVNSIPKEILKFILGTNSINEFIYNIKDTRVYIVHGIPVKPHGHGHILSNLELPQYCQMLEWIIYARVLLNIGVPENNVYIEIETYMRNDKGIVVAHTFTPTPYS